MRSALVVAALVVAACGSGGTSGSSAGDLSGGAQSEPAVDPAPVPAAPAPSGPVSPGPSDPTTPPATPPPRSADCGGALTIELVGGNVPAGQTVTLQVSDAALIQGGTALPRRSVGSGAATFPGASPYRLLLVDSPPAGQPVVLYVYLADGQLCDAAGCRTISACGAPLIATFDPARIWADRCHVVVVLDVGRSIQEGPAGPATLLQYRLHYY